jgi:hypothetical protein
LPITSHALYPAIRLLSSLQGGHPWLMLFQFYPYEVILPSHATFAGVRLNLPLPTALAEILMRE